MLTLDVTRPTSQTLHDVIRPTSQTLHDVPTRPSAETLHEVPEVWPGDPCCQVPRRGCQCPTVLVPMLPDGGPDVAGRRAGHTLDLSGDGVSLDLDAPDELPTTAFVLTFAGAGALGVELQSTGRTAAGRLRVGGRFAGPAHELLRPENLTPRFDRHALRFALPFAEEALERWAALGVLTPVDWDVVQVCPRCHALPTFRRGCPACGSARLTSDRLIHHFACAHVGLDADFERPGGLCCPKCRTRHLIVGADYEHMTGPYRCLECGWGAVELEQVAQCLRCELRFPCRQAHELALRGYRADRLDPLALRQASG
jgi:hypothetical protein